ncbi:MAG: cytochrome c biogenesis protein [Chlorobiaceae bacterium]|nr:cytochrome c biogenesis protein [Chlorobiaceae bacterium]
MVVVRRRWFQSPWEFREAFLVTAIAVIAGFIIEYLGAGRGVPSLHQPVNAIALAIFGVAVLGVGLAFRNNAVVQWLGGIPLGLALIFAIAVLSFIGGVLPQGEAAPDSLSALLRINQIFSSWPFALTVLFFLANLGFGLSWKLLPFKMQNLQFILFHAGFWLALACGVFGSSDLQRFVVPIEEGKANNLGYSMNSDVPTKLPFSIYLENFSLEEYPPQLLLYDPQNDKLLVERSQAIIQVRKGVTASWKGVNVNVLDYLSYGLRGADGVPQPADQTAGIPFAKVQVTSNGTSFDTWISTGSPMLKPDAADLGGILLIMVPGSPKAFNSAVSIQGENGEQKTATLGVNQPLSFNGWKLYQMGYDEKMGRWSQLSLIEVIRDPWLPAVYLGLFMIMAGNILFFWNGIKRSEVS